MCTAVTPKDDAANNELILGAVDTFTPRNGNSWPKISFFAWKLRPRWGVFGPFDYFSATILYEEDSQPLTSRRYASREEVWYWVSSCFGSDLWLGEEDFILEIVR